LYSASAESAFGIFLLDGRDAALPLAVVDPAWTFEDFAGSVVDFPNPVAHDQAAHENASSNEFKRTKFIGKLLS
jgi:hypothetical protein